MAMMGGWHPIFFDDYSSTKVDQLINHIQEGRVASIEIQYDRNSDLAKKVVAQIAHGNRAAGAALVLQSRVT